MASRPKPLWKTLKIMPPDNELVEITDAQKQANLLLPIHQNDHSEGPAGAQHTLVEYGDYECPECGTLFWTIRQLRERLGDDLRLVFRQYPLSGVHPHAQMAAEAAEAAGAQERYWQMHELLFGNQIALAEKNLLAYAEQIGLDVKRFKGELKDRVYEDRVREDFKRGVANGVYGTPGLFLNGVRYSGPIDFDSLFEKLTLR